MVGQVFYLHSNLWREIFVGAVLISGESIGLFSLYACLSPI